MCKYLGPIHPPMPLGMGSVTFVHGSGFCPEFGQSHFRTILLPPMETLEQAYDKMESFIKRRIQ